MLGPGIAGLLLVLVAPPAVLLVAAVLAYTSGLLTLGIRPHAPQQAAIIVHRVRDLPADSHC